MVFRRKILCLNLCILLVLSILFTNTLNANAAGTFDITVTPDVDGYGSVSVSWSEYDYSNKNFKVYKSSDAGTTYESIGIDFTSISQVKVLQVYPISNASNQLKTWLETNGYGKGIIKVDAVYIDNYNSNPYAYLKDSSGNWKYDVIFFGTWDSNASKGLNATSKTATEEFIKAGKGCIFGHDTISWESATSVPARSVYFNQLAKYVNVSGNNYWGSGKSNISSYVKITKKGLFTTYPWDIGEIGTVLTVPATHNVGQSANGDVWLRLTNQSAIPESSSGNFYLTTYNNCALIMTGHSGGSATADEQKILANLIFYMNQLLFDTYITSDNSAQDVAPPDKPVIKLNGDVFSFTSSDNSSVYKYYVESYDKNDTTATGLIDRSTAQEVEVLTGLKSFRYVYDNNANTVISNANSTETVNYSVAYDDSKRYLHVAAVDNADNVSETETIDLWTDRIITTNCTGAGIVSNTSIVRHGTDTSIFIIPAEGFSLTSLIIDNVSVTPTYQYNFLNITQNHTIDVVFTMTQTKKMQLLSNCYGWIDLNI